MVAVVGAFLLLTGRAVRWGVGLAVVGAGYFVGMKWGIMPRFMGGEESFVSDYAGLHPAGQRSFGGVLETVACIPRSPS
jgi:hypothetical protein